ncbi:MAG: NUDIX domain-containing protein [Nocardioidaceae bacterium]
MPYTSEFPPFYVTADMVVLSDDVEPAVLLVRRGAPPYQGCLALPGGFVEPNESLDDAARRELLEETGVGVADALRLEQVGAYGAPGRDPRGRIVSVAYLAVVERRPPPTAGDDAADAGWFPVSGLADGDLAFDHAEILRDAIGRV